MIIKALTIENFKGIREPVRVEFKPITLLFGPNSSGKSTIVQALHYVREILERNNVDADRTAGADESLDLGGFKNLIHKHDLNLPMRLKFEIFFSPLADYSDFFTKKVDNAWLEFEIKWSNFLNEPLVFSSAVGLDGEEFGKIVCDESGKKTRIVEINFKHHLLRSTEIDLESKKVDFPDLLSAIITTIKKDFIFSDNKIELFVNQQTALPQHIRLNSELENDEATAEENADRWEHPERDEYLSPSTWETLNDFFHTYFGGLTSVLRAELRKFRYIGPIRKTPPRYFLPVRTEDESRWTSGLAAWDVLYKAEPEFIQKTNSWLTSENKLNSGYRIDVRKYKELDTASSIWVSLTNPELLLDNEETIEQLKRLPEKKRLFLLDEMNGVEVLPQDVGIGISQVLPVIVVTLHSNSGIVAIEQPELHIHPAFQVALGDLFISQVREQDVCFLLETHSEHLLLRMLRRIRETQENELPVDAPSLSPDKLSIHYIEQTEKGMSITPLQVDETGEFVNKWPRGFFEERDEELF
ncbi:MAG TPA: DUF3696 domain-containing protein [Nitrospirae bacterium]|nr:DUF3696 domain-containing protein [Nitrospirota bacterium]